MDSFAMMQYQKQRKCANAGRCDTPWNLSRRTRKHASVALFYISGVWATVGGLFFFQLGCGSLSLALGALLGLSVGIVTMSFLAAWSAARKKWCDFDLVPVFNQENPPPRPDFSAERAT